MIKELCECQLKETANLRVLKKVQIMIERQPVSTHTLIHSYPLTHTHTLTNACTNNQSRSFYIIQ